MFDTLWQDIRYALRSLRRTHAFALTVVLSLAVGIAGNAAIFSVADALLFQTPPGVRNPDRLIDLGGTQDGTGFDTFSYPNFVDYRDRNTVFEALAGVRLASDALGLGTDEGAQRVQGTAVSANYFAVLGVPMALGRPFRADEDQPGTASAVAVISNRLWVSRFDGDDDIVGRVIRLNGRPITIIGVTPPDFKGHNISATDLWIPLTLRPELVGRDSRLLSTRGGAWMLALGRLKEGISIDQARAQMERIASDLQREHPDENRGKAIALAPWHQLPAGMAGWAAAFIGLLFTLVGLVLLIACANVGGILLARGVTRTPEVAIRLALGAQRSRIARLLVSESVLLAAVGALVGLLGASALIELLRAAVPVLPVPLSLDFHLDWRVLVFSALLSILAGLGSGFLPALESARTDLVWSVKAGATTLSPRRMRLRQAFVIAQVAMSLLLVVTALLFARSLANASQINAGFIAENVDVAVFDLRLAGYDALRGSVFASELLSRIEQTPGVVSATWSAVVPLTLSGVSLGPLRLPGQPADAPEIRADWNVITPDYFDTLRMGLVRGRLFTDLDRSGSGDVAIVNETFASRMWPGQDPVGQVVLAEGASGQRALRVVGVARDAKYRSLGGDPRNFIYVPLAQHYRSDISLMVRTTGLSAIPSIRTITQQLDPNLPLVQAESLEDVTAFSLFPLRIARAIAGGVGVIGLLLAGIGVYGLTAYAASQRTREMGIRIAVGARRAEVLAMIVRQAMTQALIGAVIGLTAAAMGSQFLQGLLYGIPPVDLLAFGGGAVLLITLAFVASVLPALRASRIDPMTALRAE